MERDGTFCIQMQANGVDLNVNQQATTFLYSESLYGLGVHCLHIESPDVQAWDSVLRDNERTRFRLRWYLRKRVGRYNSPWRSLAVQQAKMQYLPDMVTVDLNGTCAGVELMANCHANNFTNMPISDMVAKIAAQNGLRARVRKTQGRHSFYQATMTDAEFLDVLRDHAGAAGMGGFYSRVEHGDTLVFEPMNFSGARVAGTFGFRATLARPDIIPLTDFTVTYRRLWQHREGHRAIEARGYNVLEHEPSHWLANEASVAYPRLASGSPKAYQTPSRIDLSTHPDPGDLSPSGVRDEAISAWSRQCQSLFRSSIKLMPPAADVEPGMLVDIAAFDSRGERHYHSGKWLIYEVQQCRRPDSAYTLLNIERRNWA